VPKEERPQINIVGDVERRECGRVRHSEQLRR
jgi:hypothetical protein